MYIPIDELTIPFAYFLMYVAMLFCDWFILWYHDNYLKWQTMTDVIHIACYCGVPIIGLFALFTSMWRPEVIQIDAWCMMGITLLIWAMGHCRIAAILERIREWKPEDANPQTRDLGVIRMHIPICTVLAIQLFFRILEIFRVTEVPAP